METIKNWIKRILADLSLKDKVYHIAINFIIVLFLSVLFNPSIGLGIAIIASLGKETYEEYRSEGSGWDWKNLFADIIGMILGLFVIL